MKKPAFPLALLCASLLLAGCNPDAKTPTTADSAPAAHDMAGMDHSAMAHNTDSAASPQLTAMNEMMQQMHAVPMRGNTDHDFARHMLAHHKGAVVMADLELRDGKDATMRRLAEEIKAGQQQEITALEAAATRLADAPTNYNPEQATDPFASKMAASMSGMMRNMPQPVADPDMNFNMLMTVHHQSAVDMAQAEVAHGQDAQLKALARQMIATQQKEIAAFKAWHNQNPEKM
ncbi:DUF305 domain-containing protein [Hymenobacter sp. APR13]|uniref:DUF305 domain-containing protein n=1 Tax=Hymenobacter sp. APR13 TaxID=1356852 RepID=UPI0004E0A9DF|nr:DUF305 domain-containing protein [Hymenobacter sp. APR13]AII50715.1 hypothetical protein N008_01795 [Hymenobacter sp. APR13]